MKPYKKTDAGEILVNDEGIEKVWVPSQETQDTTVIGLAELLNETQMMADHAAIMTMLLPPEQLGEQHNQAKKFRETFVKLHQRALQTEPQPEPVRRLSDEVLPQAEAIHAFKERLLQDQENGRIHTLMWPSLLDHLARETERFMDRQEQAMAGRIQQDREEIIDFWADIMSEHSDFIAHLLDPAEIESIAQSSDFADEFAAVSEEHELQGKTDPVLGAIADLIDFKETALTAVQEAEIQSMIPPELADHVRREAILFLHELMRVDAMTGIQMEAA